jgi:hypothetical protein
VFPLADERWHAQADQQVTVIRLRLRLTKQAAPVPFADAAPWWRHGRAPDCHVVW